jgi:outer membrane protein assembly factor BamD
LPALLLALLAVGCGAHMLPAMRSDSERLATARRLREQGDCADAIEVLKTYLTNAAGAAQVDEAVYWLGDCYLRTKDWALAAGEFERLLRDYPESDSSAAASFALGEAYFGQAGREDFDQEFTVRALEQWRAYLRDHPGHWRQAEGERRVAAARARLANKMVRTGNLYLKLRLWEPARVYFLNVEEEYSGTPAASEARLGLALCAAGQGRRDDAIAELKQLEADHPDPRVAERAARARKRLERR